MQLSLPGSFVLVKYKQEGSYASIKLLITYLSIVHCLFHVQGTEYDDILIFVYDNGYHALIKLLCFFYYCWRKYWNVINDLFMSLCFLFLDRRHRYCCISSMDACRSSIHDLIGSGASELSICSIYTTGYWYSHGATRILWMVSFYFLYLRLAF